MQLQAVDKVEFISPEDFKNNYYLPKKPLVITGIAKQWPAYTKWTWDYFKEIVGNKKVGLYNNIKSDAYTPINTADDYKTFGEYVDMIKQGLQDGGFFYSIFLIMHHSLSRISPGPKT